MRILIFILSLIICIKTSSYGIFEIKNQNNIGGIIVIFVAILAFISANLIISIKGI